MRSRIRIDVSQAFGSFEKFKIKKKKKKWEEKEVGRGGVWRMVVSCSTGEKGGKKEKRGE